MPTFSELAPKLLKNFVATRPTNSGQMPENHQANVIVMLGSCMNMMAMGCSRRSWPELFKLLERESFDGSFQQDMEAMHIAVGRFLEQIDEKPAQDAQVDTTIWEALDRANWKDVSIEARTAWFAMLGLYHLSRVWVVGRQWHLQGNLPGIAFETVAQAAGHIMRSEDQHVSLQSDGAGALAAAARYAVLCGFTLDDIAQIVRQAVLTSDPTQPIDGMDMRNIDGAKS